MNAYLAGPMRGYPGFNFTAFDEAALTLESRGWVITSPADLDRKAGVAPDPKSSGDEPFDVTSALKRDFTALVAQDAIILLPGWENSKGATAERFVAEQTGLEIRLYDPASPGGTRPAEPLIEGVGQEGTRLVRTHRGADYGRPITDFGRTALIWEAILGVPVTPEQVGLCMIGIKISREVNRPKRDNRVDIAGYAETLELIAEDRAKQ